MTLHSPETIGVVCILYFPSRQRNSNASGPIWAASGRWVVLYLSHTHSDTDWFTSAHTEILSQEKYKQSSACLFLLVAVYQPRVYCQSSKIPDAQVQTHTHTQSMPAYNHVFDSTPDARNSVHSFPKIGPKWKKKKGAQTFWLVTLRSYETNLPNFKRWHSLLRALLFFQPAALHSHYERRERERRQTDKWKNRKRTSKPMRQQP